MLPIPVLSIHDLSTVRSGYGPLMKVSARSAGGQVCILHLARFNDFPGAKIVAIEPVQKTKPREKMVYFSLTAKFEWLTLVRPAATARAHSRSRNAFGEETLTSCLTRVGGPEIGWGVRQSFRSRREWLPPNRASEKCCPFCRPCTAPRLRARLPHGQRDSAILFPPPAVRKPRLLPRSLRPTRRIPQASYSRQKSRPWRIRCGAESS